MQPIFKQMLYRLAAEAYIAAGKQPSIAVLSNSIDGGYQECIALQHLKLKIPLEYRTEK